MLAIALAWGGLSTPAPAMAQQTEGLPSARPGPGIPSAASATSSVTTGPAPAALVGSPTTATAQPPPDSPSIHVTGKLLELRQLDPSGKSVVLGSVTLPHPIQDIVVIPRVALYVHMAGAEIVVVDVRDPRSPYVAWVLGFGTPFLSMSEVDQKLYARTRNEIAVFDIGNPLLPLGPAIRPSQPLRSTSPPDSSISTAVEAASLRRRVTTASGQIVTGTLVALKPEEDRVTLLVAEKEVSLSLHEVIRIDPILRTTTSSTATKESAVSFHGAIKSKPGTFSASTVPEIFNSSDDASSSGPGYTGVALSAVSMGLGVVFAIGAVGALAATSLDYIDTGKQKSYGLPTGLGITSGLFVVVGIGGLIGTLASSK